jgi:predicted peptidase
VGTKPTPAVAVARDYCQKLRIRPLRFTPWPFVAFAIGVVAIILFASDRASPRRTVQAGSPMPRLTKQVVRISEGSEEYGINYWQYLPPRSYRGKPPVLIFLHGSRETAVTDDPEELSRVLLHGPPKLVEQGVDLCFSVERRRSCFLMLAPQALPTRDWFGPSVVPIVDAMIDQARALGGDMRRVYLTGLSMGGTGTWSFAGALELDKGGRIAGSQLAAIVPVAGSSGSWLGCNISRAGVAVWAFHGTADEVVPPFGSIGGVRSVNACMRPRPSHKAILTLYPNFEHDSWTRTYDPSSRFDPHTGKPDPEGMNVYEWMLLHRRT